MHRGPQFHALLPAMMLALGVACAHADPVSEAQSSIMLGKYDRAVELLHPAAAQGDATAQYILGNMYRNGWGVPEGARFASLWYQRSAEQGNVDAQYTLGELYLDGRGVPKDYQKASYWLHRAATEGKSSAPTPQYVLGLMYQKGEGVKRDLVTAYMWINIASINALGIETQREYAKVMDTLSKSMTSDQVQTARARTGSCLATDYRRC